MGTFFPQIALAIGVLTSNRRGGLATNFGRVHVGSIAGCHCWGAIAGCHCGVPWLDAIAGCHCWVPLWGAIAGCHCGVPWLDAIAGCHGWMLATNFGRVHVGCDCWVPCWGAIAGGHCSVPCWGAIAAVPWLGCHCWVPLREKIDQSVTPFSAAPFPALITHKLACAIWGLCWYLRIFLVGVFTLFIFIVINIGIVITSILVLSNAFQETVP